MIAVDSNLLVYAHRQDSSWHKPAVACLKGLAEGSAAWAIPWPCAHEFMAIVTHPRIYSPPTPLASALAQLDAWFESPTLVLITETEGCWSTLRRMLERGRPTGAMVHDAKIVAVCACNGIRELWSADRDFSRFPGLRVRNPLL